MLKYQSLLLGAFVAAALGRADAAAPPPKHEPLRGAVVSGRALACVIDQDDEVAAWFQRLDGGGATSVDALAFAVGIPSRWHMGHGALWIAKSNGRQNAWGGTNGTYGPGADTVCRYESSELLRGRRIIGPKAKPIARAEGYFAYPMCIWDARFLGKGAEFREQIHYDYLPAGRDLVRLFLLTNVGGRGVELGGDESSVVRAIPRTAELRWSFACYSYRPTWDAKAASWSVAEVKVECTLDMPFREPFQALGRGDDFYFLTASGKLFRGPKPTKGTRRKVAPVWDDRSRVVAFVTDADADRTFLFLDEGPGGPCVFEVADGARLRPYDAALFRPGTEGPPALRKVVGYARVLHALGYVHGRLAEKK